MMENIRLNILDPATAQFSRASGDVLQLEIKGKILYPRVMIYRSYPLSKIHEFLSVRDASREDLPEIGLILDIKQFPAAMQEMISSELGKRYFVPLITEVISIRESRDHLDWEVVTDRGKRIFTVCDPYDNLRSVGESRLIITDIHNCRYEIQDYTALNSKMKNILAKYIYI